MVVGLQLVVDQTAAMVDGYTRALDDVCWLASRYMNELLISLLNAGEFESVDIASVCSLLICFQTKPCVRWYVRDTVSDPKHRRVVKCHLPPSLIPLPREPLAAVSSPPPGPLHP